MRLDPELFEPFVRFSRFQIESQDIDPVYPLLAAYYDREGFSEDAALWRTFLYVVYYHLGEAAKLWELLPEPREVSPAELPSNPKTGTERRGMRGNPAAAATHINGAVRFLRKRQRGSVARWVRACCKPRGRKGWTLLRRSFQTLPHAGEWSSYKFADLVKNVHGLPITAADIGVGGGGRNAGPVPGMVSLTGRPWKQCACSVSLQDRLARETARAGVVFDGLDQLETCLCDFNSLVRGRYYVGHDIDLMQEQLAGEAAAPLRELRAEVFAERYLGEANDWAGVRPKLKKLYRETGVIEWWLWG